MQCDLNFVESAIKPRPTNLAVLSIFQFALFAKMINFEKNGSLVAFFDRKHCINSILFAQVCRRLLVTH